MIILVRGEKMATSMVLEKIEEFVIGGSNSCVSEIAHGISSKETNLLQLIESSEPFLTNKSTDIRARGVRLISDVLHFLPKNTLSPDEAKVLASFFCDRLKDHHSITPHTLYGLLALSSAVHIPYGTPCQILGTIFREVQVQTLLHVDRRSVFNIIRNFLQNQMTELKDKLGSEFVYGFMQVMDGEKDPRNLVILFRLYPVIVQNFPVSVFAEELFEVAACYFPVDFQPRSKDADAITRDTLSDALSHCLAASPKFAQFCLPLLMEKMTSDLDTARSDAYKALALCAPVYGPLELSDYLIQIWNAIRLEIFQVFNTNTEHTILSALRSIVQSFALSPIAGKTTTSLEEFYKKVFEGCSNHLRDQDLRLLQPCSHLLEAIASASPSSCSTVLEFVIPLLLEQSKKDLPVAQSALLLEVLHSFLQICSTTLVDASTEPTLSRHKQGILEMLTSNLEDSSTRLRVASVRGISSLIINRGLIEEGNISVLCDLLTQRFLNDEEEEVRSESTTCLERLAELSPNLIKTRALPVVWSTIVPNTLVRDVHGGDANIGAGHPSWKKLSHLATDKELGQTICQFLLDQLKEISNHGDNVCIEYSLQVAMALSETSRRMLGYPGGLDYIKHTVLSALLQWNIGAAVQEDTGLPFFCHEEILNKSSEICQHVVAELDQSSASDLASCLVHFLLGEDIGMFQSSSLFNKSRISLKMLQASSLSPRVTRLVIFLQAVVCAVGSQVVLPSQDALLPLLLDLALFSPDGLTNLIACKSLAGILNKFDGLVYRTFAETSKQKILDQVRQTDDGDARVRGLRLWIWLTKSFILRGHPLSTEYLNTLMDFLDTRALSSSAADGINLILSESSDILNVKFHAEVKLMYRQRVFQQCLPRIKRGILEADDAVRPYYLQTLSHLLSHIPRPVLMASLESLLPLFIRSLDQENPLMYLSTLETFHELISDASEVVAQQVTSMIPAFLRLSQYEPSMKVRIAALKCLKSLTQLSSHYVLPYKSDVTRQLTIALDDKKRLVRREAVDARCRWFLLGTA
ncbi:MMS19 nucleotide excision repair protein homolog isoform X3 [Apostichopus japonicus]|uniref:MMS19 nucleotide excision repair protein homolog isoform X3 n=1 Tax=Stichopus japonicus TaxID=307972 RepID=UPI003AB86F00